MPPAHREANGASELREARHVVARDDALVALADNSGMIAGFGVRDHYESLFLR